MFQDTLEYLELAVFESAPELRVAVVCGQNNQSRPITAVSTYWPDESSCLDPDIVDIVEHFEFPHSSAVSGAYLGASHALQYAAERGHGGALIVGLSQLIVVEQLRGTYRCNYPHLKRLREEVVEEMNRFDGVRWNYVPLRLNQCAAEAARRLYQRLPATLDRAALTASECQLPGEVW